MSSKIIKIILKNCPPGKQAFAGKRFKGSIGGYGGFIKEMERDCDRYCHIPRIPKQKLAILNAGTDVGQIVGLFLKQQKVIHTLALFDMVKENNVCKVATDLSHLDTSTEVEAYEGWASLHLALKDAEVVVICGGKGCSVLQPSSCDASGDEELFCASASSTRALALACARICPSAFVLVAVPPIDANFALVAHVLKGCGELNNKRVMGVNALAAMRANTLASALSNGDPQRSFVAVVGGCGRDTAVPCFSCESSYCYFPKTEIDHLVELVRNADDIICRVKACAGQAHLSAGFAVARCALLVMTGLFEKQSFIDSALCWQDQPESCYGMQICASTVTVGATGIVQFGVPALTTGEQELLDSSREQLQDQINLGRSVATGEEFVRKRKEKV